MNLKDLSKPLPISSIDFRIQSINRGGYATILAYKDARVDMDVLDSVVGSNNWQRHHSRDNKNCIVSIYCEQKKEWISKEDVGTESNTEREKGVASDSFKRACTNWGIGRELYAYPNISVKLNANEFLMQGDKVKATYELKLKEWVWSSEFNEKEIIFLRAIDAKGKVRFLFGKSSNSEQSTPTTEHLPEQDKRTAPTTEEELKKIIEWAIKKKATIKVVETYYKLTPLQKAEVLKAIK